jgi:hypothetical protein
VRLVLTGSLPFARPSLGRYATSMEWPTRSWRWPCRRYCWAPASDGRCGVGATFVAIDTLVHNFLHRTGILQRLCADHPYGDRCYRPGGCAGILGLLAAQIDAREFNPTFPATFPRFVQSALWRYCAGNGLAICNGNRIDDDTRCDNGHCQLFRRCDRIAFAQSTRENHAKSMI